MIDEDVGDRVTNRPFRAAGVEALEGRGIAALVERLGTDGGENRLAGNAHVQSGQIAVLVERAGHLALGDRVIAPVQLILFARPDQLDLLAGHFLGDQHRLAHIVLAGGATAKAAAQIHAIDLALVERQTGGLRGRGERGLAVLGRGPDFALVGGPARGGVHRLHRRVVLIGHAVGRLDLFSRTLDRSLNVAALVADESFGRAEALVQHVVDGLAVESGELAAVVIDLHGIKRGLGAPPRVGDHDNGVLDLENLLHAGHLFSRFGVEALQRAAPDRAIPDGCVQQSRSLEVDAVDLLAVYLAALRQTLQRLACDGPGLGVFQRRIGRRRQLGSCGRDLAIGGFTLGLGMGDDALGDGHFSDRNLPAVGCSLHQHHAGGGAAFAHVFLGIAHAAAARGCVIAPDALAGDVLARRRIFVGHFRPIGLKLFGHELGKTGDCALAHFLTADAHDDRIVSVDDDPRVHFRRFAGLGERILRSEGDAKRKAASGCSCAHKKLAAAEIHCVHDCPLPQAARTAAAACLMAARMRL